MLIKRYIKFVLQCTSTMKHTVVSSYKTNICHYHNIEKTHHVLWYKEGWWFSLRTLVTSTNKTDCHNIAVILLKMTLNTITPLISHLWNVKIVHVNNYIYFTGVFPIAHYVIKFVSDLHQVGGFFLQILWFPPPITLTAMIYS